MSSEIKYASSVNGRFQIYLTVKAQYEQHEEE